MKNVGQDVRRGIRQGFNLAGLKIVKDIKKDLARKPRFGRVYYWRRTKKGPRERHVASVPGEAPANFTGKLSKTTDFKVHGHKRFEVFYKETKEVKYGKWLEFGTKKMKKRPAIRIAINGNEKDIENFMNQEMKKALS